jgi:hypothetical protein
MEEQGDRVVEDVEDLNEEEEEVVLQDWLWVNREPIRNLRIGVRSAGIAAGELTELEFARQDANTLALILLWQHFLVDPANRLFHPHQFRCLAFAVAFEMQRQIRALCPMPIQLNIRTIRHRSIRNLDQNWCWTELRWRRADLFRLARCTGLEDDFVCRLDNDAVFPGETVLIVGLYAQAWPLTQEKIAYEFGFSNQSVVSRILSYFCNHIYSRFIHLIQSDGVNAFEMWTAMAPEFVQRVLREWPDCPPGMEDCGAFVDGSANYTCRPCQRQEHTDAELDTQRAWYNSYYGNHGQKFQGVVAPNGMFLQMYGPVSIRVHDSPLVDSSGLNDKLAWLSQHSGVTIKALGDSAYPRRSHLLKHASYRMAQKRICVEWAFGKMQQTFAVTDFEAHLQVYLNRPARTYLVCTILCNMHTCCYGSLTGRYFRCRAPSLEDYCSM